MAHRTTITLDDEIFAFLDHVVGDNRSVYINALLKQERTNFLKQALIKASREELEIRIIRKNCSHGKAPCPMA